MLWTDYIDPAELTGYTRAYLEDYEATQGSLASVLPNRFVADISVEFHRGGGGLVPIADFRAYDAEPTIGKLEGGSTVTIKLPALGRNTPVTEYNQLRARNAAMSDEKIRETILNAAKASARAVVGRLEHLRGVVLDTGKATVSGFMDDDFGRNAGSSFSAAVAISTSSADLLGMAQDWIDGYSDRNNGDEPGAVLVSPKILRAIGGLDQFATALVGGGSRPATVEQALASWEAAGLPPLVKYNRKVNVGGTTTRVLNEDKMYFVPALVDPNSDEGSPLGATHWGQTLTSTSSEYELADTEQPGLVIGAYRNPKPPMIAEVISDAIALPTLANPDLSMVVDVI